MPSLSLFDFHDPVKTVPQLRSACGHWRPSIHDPLSARVSCHNLRHRCRPRLHVAAVLHLVGMSRNRGKFDCQPSLVYVCRFLQLQISPGGWRNRDRDNRSGLEVRRNKRLARSFIVFQQERNTSAGGNRMYRIQRKARRCSSRSRCIAECWTANRARKRAPRLGQEAAVPLPISALPAVVEAVD